MVRPSKVWSFLPQDTDLGIKLGQELDISPVVAQVLINRGIIDAASAQHYFQDGAEGLGDAWQMRGISEAVPRLTTAIAKGEKITIYGDYDVDGITATALVNRVLTRLGAIVEFYIPERQGEGYGLNDAALATLKLSGTSVIVTVDCGINAVAEVAKMAGELDIIITDHHQPPAILPSAYAIINPKQPECSYPFKQLAGVGVAYKLCQALWQAMKPGEELYEYLDLVAIGTIADIVSLTGENRILVKLGLAELTSTDNPGLKALIAVSGLTNTKIDVTKVGFVLAPRLNAAGRIKHASAGVELLLTADVSRAAELAAVLDKENIKRQVIEKELLVQVEKMLEGSDPASQKVLVLAGEDWHSGVIGIVASRLIDKYFKPVVMISIQDGVGKGSCRSIPGFDIYRALEQCTDILIQFGGHQYAAGLSIAADNIGLLRDRLSQVAAEWLTDEDYLPVLSIDSRLALTEINKALLEQLACLSPHGMGNSVPVFACENLTLSDIRPLGQDGRHFKLQVEQNGITRNVMAWDMADVAGDLSLEETIDVAFVPEFNDWQGQRSIQLRARDLRRRENLPVGLVLSDARNTNEKIDYIIRLIQTGQKIVITTNNRQHAIEVAWRLRRRLPVSDRKIAPYYLALSKLRRNAVQTAWNDGRLQVAIVADDCWGSQNSPEHMVIYEPPIGKLRFGNQCREIVGWIPINLHFLYGQEDARKAGSELVARYPDRTAVGWVYLVLKACAVPEGAICENDRTLARKVRQTFSVSFTEEGVSEALTILDELCLIKSTCGSGRRTLYLNVAPAVKLDIDCSATYRQCAMVRKEYDWWSRELLQTAVVKLWKKAIDSI